MILSSNASRYLIVILFMFLIGAIIGYGLEVFYRRFFSAKKWVNPGFMKGPYLPLYGFGLVLMFGISALIMNFSSSNLVLYNPLGNLFNNNIKSRPTVYDLIPILTITAALILLEFIGGLIFVKGFKVRLWDYTNLRGNIMGIICPMFSFFWFVITVIYYYALNPFIYQMFISLFNYIFLGGSSGDVVNFIFIFILGIAYGIFILDLVSSLGLFRKVLTTVKESNTLKHYEKLKNDFKNYVMKEKIKAYEKIAANDKFNLLEHSKRNITNIKNNNNKFKEKINKLIYIDPNKKAEDNYGTDSRPKKDS